MERNACALLLLGFVLVSSCGGGSKSVNDVSPADLWGDVSPDLVRADVVKDLEPVDLVGPDEVAPRDVVVDVAADATDVVADIPSTDDIETVTPTDPAQAALAAVLAVMNGPLANEDGWVAYGMGQPLPAGTAVVDALGQAFPETPAVESLLVYVDPAPAALLAHPVHWAFVPTDGSVPVLHEGDVPPDFAAFDSGIMVQDPTPRGESLVLDNERLEAGEPGDYGDAPDEADAYLSGTEGTYPTHETHDGARTEATGALRLGESLTVESGAADPDDPDGEPNLTDRDLDDGLLWVTWKGTDGVVWHRAVVTVTVDALGPGVQYLNMLVDYDRDGSWDEPDERDRPVNNMVVNVVPGSSQKLDIPVPVPVDAVAQEGAFWVRVALTRDAVPEDWNGGGDLGDGEVEDHFIRADDQVEGGEPLPPPPGPGPGQKDDVCGVEVHRRALVVAGVDLPGKGKIVEATANLMATSLQDDGWDIGAVASGTPAQVTAALNAFISDTRCLDEALIFFVAHGTAKGGGAMAFADGDKATWWPATEVFAALKTLGACAGGKLSDGTCETASSACRQTVAFEVCHSGAFADELDQYGDETDGRNVFFSAAENESAYTDGTVGAFSSAFAKALAEGKNTADAFGAAAKAAKESAEKLEGEAQNPVNGLSKPGNCPCDCCGDGVIQDTQKVISGQLQPQPTEQCDPLALPNGCAAWELCTAACVCQCTPDCDEKTCGDDGCGGSCGECLGVQVCQNGMCTEPPPPAPFPVFTKPELIADFPWLGSSPFSNSPGEKLFVAGGGGAAGYGMYSGQLMQSFGVGEAWGIRVIPVDDGQGGEILSVLWYGPSGIAGKELFPPSGGMTIMDLGGNTTCVRPMPAGEGQDPELVVVRYSDNIWGNKVEIRSWSTEPFPGWTSNFEGGFARGSVDGTISGNIISAWASGPGAPIVAVANTGEVIYHNPSGGVTEVVGKVPGEAPDVRDVNCLNGCCLVSRWDGAVVTPLAWKNTDQPPTILDNVAAGAGSVSVDAVMLEGKVEFLTTGFNDNSRVRYVAAADCSADSVDIAPVADCTNPGHGIYVADEHLGITYLAISCNGSNNIVFEPTAVTPGL